METRPLGRTALRVAQISFGASSLGHAFRPTDLAESLRSVQVAIDLGMTFIDTSAFYGCGISECVLGFALRDLPRDRYLIGSKLGRYDGAHFDFSARRVAESVDVSLKRLGVDHLDVMFCHDVEFADLDQVITETIPALRRAQAAGKVRFVGISGYPLRIFRQVLDRTALDVILSYNHYTLQNTALAGLVPYLKAKGVGIMNAAPFSARLLTNQPLPAWHKATPEVRARCRQAAEHCTRRGVDIAQLALQFSIANRELDTCVVGSANPERIRQWADWAALPLDTALVAEVQAILAPVRNWSYVEGRPENNDPDAVAVPASASAGSGPHGA